MTVAVPASIERHGELLMAQASGRALSLLSPGQNRLAPPGLASVEQWRGASEASGLYSSILSVGQLGLAGNLADLLRSLAAHMDDASTLYFCEPTMRERRRVALPNDVTSTLWTNGFSVFECRRERLREGLRNAEYCWGRARLTPPFAVARVDS